MEIGHPATLPALKHPPPSDRDLGTPLLNLSQTGDLQLLVAPPYKQKVLALLFFFGGGEGVSLGSRSLPLQKRHHQDVVLGKRFNKGEMGLVCCPPHPQIWGGVPSKTHLAKGMSLGGGTC